MAGLARGHLALRQIIYAWRDQPRDGHHRASAAYSRPIGAVRRAGGQRERDCGHGLRRRLTGLERRDRLGQVRGDGRRGADRLPAAVALKFRAGELAFTATVAEASEAPSPQTGDPLRTLTIQFRAQKMPMHEQVLLAAVQPRACRAYSLSHSGLS